MTGFFSHKQFYIKQSKPGYALSRHILFLCILFIFSSCATWHQRTIEYNNAILAGDFEQANKILSKDKKQSNNKNAILYYMNKGYVEFMLGNVGESNKAFEQAEMLIEDQTKNLVLEAAVLLSNPEILPYRPEDFEVIMINFYKALNFLSEDNTSGAMVEVRKINIKLNQLNDKYPDHKNRYQRDAFAHLLMGLIYDAAGDFNNAFIAYRNSYDVYQSDYIKNFKISAPEQLKKDLMRTAYLCGFTTELNQYEREFKQQYVHNPSEKGDLILFWLNGFGPYKAEWGVTFVKQKRGDGAIVFHNEQLGLTFPFFIGSGYSDHERNSIEDLNILRVVFPQYIERKPLYNSGIASLGSINYPLEMAENINEIAFKTLHDRMVREFANSLLRLAAKKGVEKLAKDQNAWLGLAVSITNSLTEKTDTRNWQTLPYSISYSRVPLETGENDISLRFSGSRNSTKNLQINSKGKKTQFHIFHTMEMK